MTPEELHHEAVIEHLIQQLTDAVESDHEARIQSYMERTREQKECMNSVVGEETLLEEHYRSGGPHPHDYKLPLNMWEDVKD